MPIGNVRLYENVSIVYPAEKDIFVYHAILDKKTTGRIKWDRSKRLLPGSLLVFSSNNFVSAYYAIVHMRDEKLLSSKSTIKIVFQDELPEQGLMDDTKYIMLECEVYFEAYR